MQLPSLIDVMKEQGFAYGPEAGPGGYMLSFEYPNGYIGNLFTNPNDRGVTLFFQQKVPVPREGGNYSLIEIPGVPEVSNATTETILAAMTRVAMLPDTPHKDFVCMDMSIASDGPTKKWPVTEAVKFVPYADVLAALTTSVPSQPSRVSLGAAPRPNPAG